MTDLQQTLIVRRDQPTTSELRHARHPPLADRQVRVRVDRFALTSNNITYAAFGDTMNYWAFYPVRDLAAADAAAADASAAVAAAGDAGWGIVPVWGFGTVIESTHPDIATGERYFGYWPMASHAVLLAPDRVRADGFSETAAHRRELNPIYNRYQRCAADPLYTPDTEDVQALLRPLYITSWLIDDFLADNAFFGADTMLLSSASSKTAYGTAFQLALRGGLRVVGLTSAANRAFCESLGCYTHVLSYEELARVPADARCVYIDFAGSAPLRRAVHARFANLAFSSAIGGTHVAELGGTRDLPGPRATLFFAPAQIQKRTQEWGAKGLGERLLAAWRAFAARVSDPAAPWLVVEHHDGEAAVRDAYAAIAAGRMDPRAGHVLSFHARP
jgi:hypothetical protein